MRKQSLYRYDKTIYGLENLYIALKPDTFFLGIPNIVTEQNNHKLTTGYTYMIMWITDIVVEYQLVKLIDVYCDNVQVNLDLQDVSTHKCFSINFNIHDKKPQWYLLDLHSFRTNKDNKIIHDYCQCK